MPIDVEHIAKLARLGLTAEEKELFGRQLSAILDYANVLQKIDTSQIAPTSHSIPMKNVLREDATSPTNNVDEIIANGPDVEGTMFRVPKILE